MGSWSSWWISPNGEIISVKSHIEYVFDNYERFGFDAEWFEKNKKQFEKTYDSYTIMLPILVKHWVAVHSMRNEISFYLQNWDRSSKDKVYDFLVSEFSTAPKDRKVKVACIGTPGKNIDGDLGEFLSYSDKIFESGIRKFVDIVRHIISESHTAPGWWVNKNNDIRIADGSEHFEYSIELGIKDPGTDDYSEDERTDKILIATIKRGWIRIRDYDQFLAVTLPKINDFDIFRNWLIKHKNEFPKSFDVFIDRVPNNYRRASHDWFLSTDGIDTSITAIINEPNSVYRRLNNKFG